jgi:hypothetical protein
MGANAPRCVGVPYVKVKVKLSRYRSGQALGVPRG